MHPDFYDKSDWPLRDREVRSFKDQLLYNVRKFRSLVPDMHAEARAEDQRLAENLGGFARHIGLQRAQRSERETRLAGGYAVDSLPPWEVSPEESLATLPRAATPLSSRLRVFVYDESIPEIALLTQGPAYCHNRQWGMDVGFHDFFRVSPLRTMDPDEADFFFVPAYAICLQVAGILNREDIGSAFKSLIARLPYFSRTLGRDHIFSLHYVDLFTEWRELAPLSVFLTPETEVGWEQSRGEFALDVATHPPFDPNKDVSVPPFMRLTHILNLHHHARPLAERSILIAFAGKLWADVEEAFEVRSHIRDRLSHKPDVTIVVGDSVNELLSPDSMARLMGDARFCLVPRGRAAWSVRFFEALWSGCVPALLSDHYQMPFEALFDVTEFVVKWPMSRIDDSLYTYLAELPLDVVESYAQAAKRARCWFVYPPPEVSWLGQSESRL